MLALSLQLGRFASSFFLFVFFNSFKCFENYPWCGKHLQMHSWSRFSSFIKIKTMQIFKPEENDKYRRSGRPAVACMPLHWLDISYIFFLFFLFFKKKSKEEKRNAKPISRPNFINCVKTLFLFFFPRGWDMAANLFPSVMLDRLWAEQNVYNY